MKQFGIGAVRFLWGFSRIILRSGSHVTFEGDIVSYRSEMTMPVLMIPAWIAYLQAHDEPKANKKETQNENSIALDQRRNGGFNDVVDLGHDRDSGRNGGW